MIPKKTMQLVVASPINQKENQPPLKTLEDLLKGFSRNKGADTILTWFSSDLSGFPPESPSNPATASTYSAPAREKVS